MTLHIRQLAIDANRQPNAAVDLMVERLRRMEDGARSAPVDRQTLQKIISARRLLGDRVDFGKVRSGFLIERASAER